jgi:hypothetical protein
MSHGHLAAVVVVVVGAVVLVSVLVAALSNGEGDTSTRRGVSPTGHQDLGRLLDPVSGSCTPSNVAMTLEEFFRAMTHPSTTTIPASCSTATTAGE